MFNSMYSREDYEYETSELNRLKGKMLTLVAQGYDGLAAKPILDDLDARLDKCEVKLRMTARTLTLGEEEKRGKQLAKIRTWERGKGISHHTNPTFGHQRSGK